MRCACEALWLARVRLGPATEISRSPCWLAKELSCISRRVDPSETSLYVEMSPSIMIRSDIGLVPGRPPHAKARPVVGCFCNGVGKATPGAKLLHKYSSLGIPIMQIRLKAGCAQGGPASCHFGLYGASTCVCVNKKTDNLLHFFIMTRDFRSA